MKHDWDMVTMFCKRCGAGYSGVLDGKRARECEPGVVGISVEARGRRLGGLVGIPFNGFIR